MDHCMDCKNDFLIDDFLTNPRYYIGEDWNIYYNGPVSGPIGQKIYPWRNITRITDKGYYIFTYKRKYLKVHRVVFKFYYGFIQNQEINHIDGNKLNNNPLNLELVTTRENLQHAIQNDLFAIGEKTSIAKLTNSQVKDIKNYISQGLRISTIARMYGVHRETIGGIKRGKTWKYIN